MSLKIICGRAGCGKSTYMLEDMELNPNSIYIVPEQYTYSAEKKIIEKLGFCGLGNPQVLSFHRLAEILLSKYASPVAHFGGAAYEMLVSYCANNIASENLHLFGGLVKKKELNATAASVITTFKRYRITPEMLQKAIKSTNNVLLGKKLEDSLIIYQSYHDYIKSSDINDTFDILTLAANLIADESCDYFDSKCVYIDQFSSFDPTEYNCIFQMMKRAKRMCIGLCMDDSAIFTTVKKTYSKIIREAESSGVEIEPDEIMPHNFFNAGPMIKHLEKCYFDDNDIPFSGTDGSISTFSAKTPLSEIHNVAGEIVRLVRDNGYRFRDISVVARDIEIYKGLIDRVFPIYDIPVFLDRKIPLANHSVALFITSILDIVISGFTYENVFKYIKSPFSPITEYESDILENYCLAVGIRPYAWGKPFYLKGGVYDADSSFSHFASEESLNEINRIREMVYNPLNELKKNLSNVKNVSDISDVLFSFLEKLSFERNVQNYAVILEENGDNLSALRTVQVYNIMVEIFNDICTVLGNQMLSLKEFRLTLQAGFDAVEIGTIPTASDCVTAGSIDRIKGHGAKVLFLIGVNNGKFPLSASDSGLFTDDDKNELEKLGIEMPPSLSEKNDNENLLIYDAITCAGERMYFSYPIADDNANALICSEIITRVQSIFPDSGFDTDIISQPDTEKIITSKKAVFNILVSHLREYYNESKPLSPVLSAAAHYFMNDEIYAPLLKHAADMTSYTNKTSDLSADMLGKYLGNEMSTSISRLEAYNKCPFSYFAKYILNLIPRKKFEINVSDSGSFLHDFLDKFSEFIVNSIDSNGNHLSWRTIDNSFIDKNVPEVLASILMNVNSEMLEIPRIKALFDRLCRAAKNSAYAIRNHLIKGEFVPMGYEINFDKNGDFKPINIKLADGKKVVLRGRIDRADEFALKMPDGSNGKFVRIVDYKSSKKTLVLSDVYHGLQLQLFVYLSALCDNGFSPAGILYCNLTDPIVDIVPGTTDDEIQAAINKERRMSGIVVSEFDMLDHMGGKEVIGSSKNATVKNFNNMFRHINRTIQKTAENIYKGIFPINCTADACDLCDYRMVCRFENSLSGCTKEENEKISDEEIWTLVGGENNDELD